MENKKHLILTKNKYFIENKTDEIQPPSTKEKAFDLLIEMTSKINSLENENLTIKNSLRKLLKEIVKLNLVIDAISENNMRCPRCMMHIDLKNSNIIDQLIETTDIKKVNEGKSTNSDFYNNYSTQEYNFSNNTTKNVISKNFVNSTKITKQPKTARSTHTSSEKSIKLNYGTFSPSTDKKKEVYERHKFNIRPTKNFQRSSSAIEEKTIQETKPIKNLYKPNDKKQYYKSNNFNSNSKEDEIYIKPGKITEDKTNFSSTSKNFNKLCKNPKNEDYYVNIDLVMEKIVDRINSNKDNNLNNLSIFKKVNELKLENTISSIQHKQTNFQNIENNTTQIDNKKNDKNNDLSIIKQKISKPEIITDEEFLSDENLKKVETNYYEEKLEKVTNSQPYSYKNKKAYFKNLSSPTNKLDNQISKINYNKSKYKLNSTINSISIMKNYSNNSNKNINCTEEIIINQLNDCDKYKEESESNRSINTLNLSKYQLFNPQEEFHDKMEDSISKKIVIRDDEDKGNLVFVSPNSSSSKVNELKKPVSLRKSLNFNINTDIKDNRLETIIEVNSVGKKFIPDYTELTPNKNNSVKKNLFKQPTPPKNNLQKEANYMELNAVKLTKMSKVNYK